VTQAAVPDWTVNSLFGFVGFAISPQTSLAAGTGLGLSGNMWDTGQVVLDNILLTCQTPGGPTLNILRSDDSVAVSWPTTDGFTLQPNSNLSLTATNWTTSRYSVSTNNGTSRVTITPPAGNLYFRRYKP